MARERSENIFFDFFKLRDAPLAVGWGGKAEKPFSAQQTVIKKIFALTMALNNNVILHVKLITRCPTMLDIRCLERLRLDLI